jgi:hypothetical protein
MSLQPQDDLLSVLRSNLRRIEEESSQHEPTPEATELKTLLLRRIAIIEVAMENLAAIIAKNTGEN